GHALALDTSVAARADAAWANREKRAARACANFSKMDQAWYFSRSAGTAEWTRPQALTYERRPRTAAHAQPVHRRRPEMRDHGLGRISAHSPRHILPKFQGGLLLRAGSAE